MRVITALPLFLPIDLPEQLLKLLDEPLNLGLLLLTGRQPMWPKYSEATARGNIVPPHWFIDMFLLLLLRDLHGLTTPWEILSGDNIAENDYCHERRV